MTTPTRPRPPLTLLGGDVELVARTPDGRALGVFLGRDGRRTPFSRPAHCFELRGIGWHLAEIKRLIAGLPLQGSAPVAPTQAAGRTSPRDVREASHVATGSGAPRPRGYLHAHFAADRED